MFFLILVLRMLYVHCSFVDHQSFMFGVKCEDKLIDVITGMSYLDCVKECLHRQRCLSVNYRSSFQICELNQYNKSMVLQTQSRESGYLTTSMEDWHGDVVHDCSATTCAINEKCILVDGSEACIASDCGNGVILNGLQPKHYTIGLFSKSQYTCPDGYVRGKAYGSCRSNGEWEEPSFVCEMDCGKPDLPKGQNVSFTSTIYPSTANVTCENRYTAADPANVLVSIGCTANGTWTDSTLQCIWEGCPSLETIQNPDCVNLSASNGEYIGDYARYKGSKSSGQFVGPFAYRNCRADQTWSDIGNIVCTQDSDCEDIQLMYTISGIYGLQRPEKTTLVYCDMDFGLGGWTVIQRRETGKVNFKRVWNDYKNGFGDVNTDYWIGNDIIHDMTYPSGKRAIFLMEDKNGNERFSEYSTFIVASEGEGYKLTISGYVHRSGAAGDSVRYNANGNNFTTIDRDQDKAAWGNCAVHYHGGWWYGGCHTANPNGMLGHDNAGGMVWSSWKGMSYSMARMVIMLKN